LSLGGGSPILDPDRAGCVRQESSSLFISLSIRESRSVRRVSAGLAAGLLLTALAVIPATANAGSTKLTNPAVSPREATTSTTIRFTVSYTNREGSPADSVVALIDGVAHSMAGSGADWKHGVPFRYTTRLSTGTHTISFRATARDKFVDQIGAGRVTVAAAPKPTPAPTVESHSGTGTTTARPTPTAVTGSGAAPEPRPTPAAASARRPASRPASDAAGAPIPAPGSISGPGASAGGDRSGRGAGAPTVQFGGAGDISAYLQALGIGATTPPMVRILVSLVGSTGAMTLLMAFLFFGKRRRDGEPPAPDEVLHANAARGSGQAATSTLVPPRIAPPGVPEEELGMPRWRRPSLLEARKMDPSRMIAEAPAPLSFDHGSIGPVDGYERRLVRYHVVRLLDVPDEFQASEIGLLTHGDEVQLLQRSGTYWLVLCPDGRQGWIHKMTLGEVVGAPPAPSARQAWGTSTIESHDVDEDVLLAFMTARSRA
ncbi:MAG TPA: hypothetical protein VKA85_06735, partial [Candidatus Limnocylindrales bacterium]|nr:hypothetical protein [Candidatus Limnocylindrales bacterium]